MKQLKNKEPKQKKIVTQYVTMEIPSIQVLNDYVTGYGVPSNGFDFNHSGTFSSLYFCSPQEANHVFKKLDFHRFSEVLNFVNKKWGWKVLNITPIIETEKSGYSPNYWSNTKTTKFLYTFYREVEE